MRLLLCLLIFLPWAAFSQTAPHGGVIPGQIWTPLMWNQAWQSKVDNVAGVCASCTITNPTVTAGTWTGATLVSPNLGSLASLSVTGATTLLQGTGRDVSVLDETTRARINVANGKPLWFGSHLELASTQTPQNATEFTLLGFSGNQVPLSGSQTYQLLNGTVALNGATSSDLVIYQFNAQTSVAYTAPNSLFVASFNAGIVSGATGPVTAVTGQVNIPVSQTGLSNMNPVGGQFEVTAASNAGGISGTTSGRAYGLYSQVGLNTGATFWSTIEGAEFDLGVQTGASAAEVDGLSLVLLGSHATHGLNARDSGLVFGSGNPSTGWDYGIRFGGSEAATPFATTASLMWIGRAMTLAYGWDASLATFSTAFLKSAGFLVDGSGNITGASYKVASTAGVTCSGSPTASFASTGGIVTHC